MTTYVNRAYYPVYDQFHEMLDKRTMTWMMTYETLARFPYKQKTFIIREPYIRHVAGAEYYYVNVMDRKENIHNVLFVKASLIGY